MTTTFFIFSLFGMCAMVGYKFLEIRERKIHLISNLFKKGDTEAHKLIQISIRKYYLYKKIAKLFFFDFLPVYLYEVLVKLKDYVAKKYYSYSSGDGFRGRRILKNNGSVSSFLQKISEKKPNHSHRKI